MAKVLDVAVYILESRGPMTAMKLQKLVYYAQAWSLVWDERPLFDGVIEAWANGPVSPELYREHRGKFEVQASDFSGKSSALSSTERETLDGVLNHYGDKSSLWLSELSHAEPPWREARDGLAPGEPGGREISHCAMAEYYGSLV